MIGLRAAADCLSRLRGLRPILHYCRMEGTASKNPYILFEERLGPGLVPVGGEFQPLLATRSSEAEVPTFIRSYRLPPLIFVSHENFISAVIKII